MCVMMGEAVGELGREEVLEQQRHAWHPCQCLRHHRRQRQQRPVHCLAGVEHQMGVRLDDETRNKVVVELVVLVVL